jgi:KGK domain
MTPDHEIITYDSVILLTQPHKTPFVAQNIFNPVEFARPLSKTNSTCDIYLWMEQSFDCMILSPNKSWRSGQVNLSLALYPQSINLAGDDIAISLTAPSDNSITKKLTFFSSHEFGRVVQGHAGRDIYPWFRNGLDCRVLIPTKDWQYGKVKLSLIFYPDQTESTEFSLDEIRKTMIEVN